MSYGCSMCEGISEFWKPSPDKTQAHINSLKRRRAEIREEIAQLQAVAHIVTPDRLAAHVDWREDVLQRLDTAIDNHYRLLATQRNECECCGRVPDEAIVNSNHKMSCVYGPRYDTKVTVPVTR